MGCTISGLQFSINYRSRKKQIDADYLSRHCTTDVEKPFTSNYETLNSEDINVVFNNVTVDKSLNMQINVESLTLQEKQGVKTVHQIDINDLINAQKDDDVISPVYN